MTARLRTMKLRTAFLLLIGLFVAAPAEVLAHCDTMNGPVVLDAREALATGDVTPVLKWVAPHDEAQITDAFTRTMNVRGTSEEVREMADLYFFETLVRLHRASEGMPYTGLKPASTDVGPAVAAADEALATGSADELADLLTGAVRTALVDRFERALHTQEHADDNVEAGRAFVEAYVLFTHLAEEVHAAVEGASHDHAAAPASSAEVHPHDG